jgi:hypothetical protein
MRSPVRPLLLSVLVPLAAPCQDSRTLTPPADAVGPADADGPIAASFDVDPQFNPQPEPPGQVPRFVAEGGLDRAWEGLLQDPATGVEMRLEVLTESFQMNGQAVDLAQVWILFPPGPVIPPDPVHPPDPIRVALLGTLNLANGLLVLNGIIEDGRTRAHVRGEATVAEGGVSALGELMFNPQPEPPGLF